MAYLAIPRAQGWALLHEDLDEDSDKGCGCARVGETSWVALGAAQNGKRRPRARLLVYEVHRRPLRI